MYRTVVVCIFTAPTRRLQWICDALHYKLKTMPFEQQCTTYKHPPKCYENFAFLGPERYSCTQRFGNFSWLCTGTL